MVSYHTGQRQVVCFVKAAWVEENAWAKAHPTVWTGKVYHRGEGWGTGEGVDGEYAGLKTAAYWVYLRGGKVD